MDYRMFRRKYLLGCLGKLGEGLKATVGNGLTTRLSLYRHSFCSFLFLSARVLSLAGYAQPAHIGHCGPQPGFKNILKFVQQSLLLFHENRPKDIKGISKHLWFCWQQLFGLLHNITISLKSIRPNKTEIKIIAEKKLVYNNNNKMLDRVRAPDDTTMRSK